MRVEKSTLHTKKSDGAATVRQTLGKGFERKPGFNNREVANGNRGPYNRYRNRDILPN